jgi:hypothetical protein
VVSRSLEKRIKASEESFAKIQNTLERSKRDKDWRRVAEKCGDDPRHDFCSDPKNVKRSDNKGLLV